MKWAPLPPRGLTGASQQAYEDLEKSRDAHSAALVELDAANHDFKLATTAVELAAAVVEKSRSDLLALEEELAAAAAERHDLKRRLDAACAAEA